MTTLIPGFDAAYPPTNPVPSGYQFAGIYTWGPNAMRITPLSEQHALANGGLRLFAYGVGLNSCKGCTSDGMGAAAGTAHGHAFAAASKPRGLHAVCFDWEAGGDSATGRPSTEQLPGWVDYATAASHAAKDDGCLVGHYGRAEQLGKLMPAEGGSAVMDFIVLTDWTNSPDDNPVSLWWRQRFPLFCRQWGGADPLDFLVCSQEFYDALDSGIVAGPEQPVTDSETFPETGKTLAHGFYAYWTKNGGLPVFGLPITDEQTETLSDGQSHTVQYTERARLEWWPGTDAANFDVTLGRVGAELLDARAKLAASGAGLQRVLSAQPLAAALADTATRLVKVLS